MILYQCIVPECFCSKVVSTERKQVFRHYLTHLVVDLEYTAHKLGIELVFGENRFSIINALIEFSKVRVEENEL